MGFDLAFNIFISLLMITFKSDHQPSPVLGLLYVILCHIIQIGKKCHCVQISIHFPVNTRDILKLPIQPIIYTYKIQLANYPRIRPGSQRVNHLIIPPSDYLTIQIINH